MLSLCAPISRDLSRLWQAVLGTLELEISPHHFNTWLRGTRALGIDGGCLVVEARTAFNCDWLSQRLASQIRGLASELWQEPLDVRFVPRALGEAGELPGALSLARLPAPQPPVIGRVNCDFTFERYVRADGNCLAYEGCLDLAGERGLPISPMVVYGAPGMGKTHLLHALACRAVGRGLAVACLSAEEFANRYMTAMRANELPAFQASLRAVKLFVLDDLQYLAGRSGTQVELVHTIDAVGDNGGHVAIASETNPLELDLIDRLTSRLASGIVTRVEPFRREERLAYGRQLADELGAQLPSWALDRVAGLEIASVRVLRGAVHAAIGLARVDRLDLQRLDTELTRVALCAAVPASGLTVSARTIVETVARYFETTFDAIAGRTRTEPLSTARAVAVAALREQGRSLAEIASLLDGRDRSTIKGLVEKGQKVLAEDGRLRQHLAV